MSHQDIDERGIVRALRSAARMEPSVEEHSLVAARIRRSLERSGSRWRVRQWRLAAGVAASLGMLLLISALTMLASRPRTAWAEFELAAVATSHFRGWVSVHSTRPDGSDAGPIMDIDTEHGSRVSFGPHRDAGGRIGVRFMDHVRSTDSYWSPTSGKVFISELSPNERAMTYQEYSKKFNLAVDFQDQLSNMRAALGAGNLDVRSSRDGTLERFDVDWYLRDKSGRREATPVHASSYWVDPATGLIAKVRHIIRGWQNPSVLLYRYNDPKVNDIYDLGVPRDAPVLDRRPIRALKDRLDAIDGRIASGTGDGVAVVTTVTRGSQGEPSGGPVLDTLEIYAQSGNRWAWAEYLVGRAAGRDPVLNPGQKPQLAPPVGWPDIDVPTAIGLVKDLRPDDLFVHDGAQCYRSFKGSGGQSETAQASDRAYFGYPGRAWPGRYRLQTYFPWAAASMRQDSAGTETIVVDVTDMDTTERQTSHELTLNKESGLPTAAADLMLNSKGAEMRGERWTFTSNLTTAAGTVLPERWMYEMRFGPSDTRSYRTESTLRFDPAARVPDRWFEPPAKRFGPK